MAVLVALVGGLGYAAWFVMREIQQVTLAPVESVPVVLTDIDPLEEATALLSDPDGGEPGWRLPDPESPDSLYVGPAPLPPVVSGRDEAIATLDPGEFGAFREGAESVPAPSWNLAGTDSVAGVPASLAEAPLPASVAHGGGEAVGTAATPLATVGTSLFGEAAPEPGGVHVLATGESWVEVRDASGEIVFQGIMRAGDARFFEQSPEPMLLRSGQSAAIYFGIGDSLYGPMGGRGEVLGGLPLAVEAISGRYEIADPAPEGLHEDFARAEYRWKPVAEQVPVPATTIGSFQSE